jgi:hypothetical protein
MVFGDTFLHFAKIILAKLAYNQAYVAILLENLMGTHGYSHHTHGALYLYWFQAIK